MGNIACYRQPNNTTTPNQQLRLRRPFCHFQYRETDANGAIRDAGWTELEPKG
jgi:hypothetical protein